MNRPWIERLVVEGMGCLRRVDVSLTPLHALIGPNDSGKSTLLRAVDVAVRSLTSREPYSQRGAVLGKTSFSLFLGAQCELHWEHGPQQSIVRAIASGVTTEFSIGQNGTVLGAAGAFRDEFHSLFPFGEALRGGARMVRWDADRLRQASQLIPAGQTARFSDDRGVGLPGVFDVIFNREDDPREEIQERVRALFPAVRAIRLKNVSQSEKALEAVLVTGEVVPTETLSEGLLYYLAFLALEYLEPVSVLLVEEPENGLHPARIADVVRTLRKISERCQVLLATHSPLVINELQPEEVTVVTRHPQSGTVTTPLKDTANFEERSRVYALGELWLSYANGEDEAPLLKGVDSFDDESGCGCLGGSAHFQRVTDQNC